MRAVVVAAPQDALSNMLLTTAGTSTSAKALIEACNSLNLLAGEVSSECGEDWRSSSCVSARASGVGGWTDFCASGGRIRVVSSRGSASGGPGGDAMLGPAPGGFGSCRGKSLGVGTDWSTAASVAATVGSALVPTTDPVSPGAATDFLTASASTTRKDEVSRWISCWDGTLLPAQWQTAM